MCWFVLVVRRPGERTYSSVCCRWSYRRELRRGLDGMMRQSSGGSDCWARRNRVRTRHRRQTRQRRRGWRGRHRRNRGQRGAHGVAVSRAKVVDCSKATSCELRRGEIVGHQLWRVECTVARGSGWSSWSGRVHGRRIRVAHLNRKNQKQFLARSSNVGFLAAGTGKCQRHEF